MLDLFGNTKMDLGFCEKIHSDDLKEDFERNPREKAEYESLLERELISFITEADRKIKVSVDFYNVNLVVKKLQLQRARERLEADYDKLDEDPLEANPHIMRMGRDIVKFVGEAEVAGEAGSIDQAQVTTTHVMCLLLEMILTLL
jgi:hypothetical protein